MTATAVTTMTLVCELPPTSVGPNGRAHHLGKARINNRLKWSALQLTREAWEALGVPYWEWQPWPAARMDVLWCFSGPQPDDDNAWSRLKSTRDGVAESGLVTDDRHITIGAITFQRVKRAEQRVVLTFTRIGEEPA
jgi:hypothetical protein